MKFRNVRFLSVLLLAALSAPAMASDLSPLVDGDKLATFIHGISSAETRDVHVRVRVALCVAFNKCKELVSSPVIKVKAGESIDFDKKAVGERRSKVFSAEDINDALEALAREKNVRDAKPQLAVMIATCSPDGKLIEKSDSAYLDFPAANAKSKDGVIKNTVKVKLRSLQLNASVAIERK